MSAPGFLGRTVLRGLLPALIALAVLAGIAPERALAHAAFLESVPSPGETLARSPGEVRLEFSEPLVAELTGARFVELGSGEAIPVEVAASDRRLVVRAPSKLQTGVYVIEWHTVSTLDGHALEGSVSFGVRATASGRETVEQSPFARSGWLRILARAVFYLSLFFFAGGLFTAALLSGRRHPAAWLVPAESSQDNAGESGLEAIPGRAWARVVIAGWLAAGAAVAVAVVEAVDASQGFSPADFSAYLLSNVAGMARVAAVVLLVAAAALASKRPRSATVLLALALLAVAFQGHANSAAEARPVALMSDWVHLMAGSIWLGGLAQIAATWLPSLARRPRELRLRLMRSVLARFGKVALPAFLIVIATGLVNALVQVAQPEALWQTPYGLVILAKVAIVVLLGMVSYWHSMRLRPRLIGAGPRPVERHERRHWRLLGAEPLLAVGIVALAATLVTFPLPPRQLSEGDEALAAVPACDPCPLETPEANELAVAEQAGPLIAAAWIERAGPRARVRLRLLARDLEPVPVAPRVAGATLTDCGPGCFQFPWSSSRSQLAVRVPYQGSTYTARLPVRWYEESSRRARRLLMRAQNTMRGLRGLREREVVSSGPGSHARTEYKLSAPDRFAFETSRDVASTVIGERQWFSEDGHTWERRRFGGGGPAFSTRTWFRWTPYARSVRYLGRASLGGRSVDWIALMDPGTPVWIRLAIDRSSARVLQSRMIADGHFMTQDYRDFNQSIRIEPPPRGATTRP